MENNLVGEIIKERAKDIYEDGFKGATTEAGQALEAVVGLFNNVVLYPIKKANLSFKYKLEEFEKDLKREISKVDSSNIIEPPLSVLGPTLEALKYTFDTNELREMYVNLLAKSMNIETVQLTHPGYVDIIKSMSYLDAIIFQKIYKINGPIACSKVQIGFGNKVYSLAMPNYFAPSLLNDEDPFLVSSSISNLCRLGIINHEINSINGYDYDLFKSHEFLKHRLEIFEEVHSKGDNSYHKLEVTLSKDVLYLNDFGKNFGKVCIPQ